MMRKRLLLLGLAVLLFTGTVVLVTRRPGLSAQAQAPQPGVLDSKAPKDMQAIMRYRQCQPHHWRYIMLQK